MKKSQAHINKLLGRSDKMSKIKLSSIKIDNDVITNERDLGNSFNKYFASFAHELYSNIPLMDMNFFKADLPCNLNSLFLSAITT